MATNVGFDMSKEKLLCLMALDDSFAEQVTDRAGEAFWRAFIVENRKTGAITANHRFRYKNGDHWYTLTPREQKGMATRDSLIESLRKVIGTALLQFTGFEGNRLIHCHYPPDDGGDTEHTLRWLIEKDLVFVSKIEEWPPE